MEQRLDHGRWLSVVLLHLILQFKQTNIFDSNNHTCLHTAAFHDDNTEIISLLVKHGAPINAKNEGEKTALELAIEKGNMKVAELLKSFTEK